LVKQVDGYRRSALKIVDLTLPIEHAMPAFPGEPTAGFIPFSTIERDDVEMWSLALFTQIGTHIDAPRHFLTDGRAVDKIDLNQCLGPATVIHSRQAARGVIDVETFAPHADSISRTKRVLLDTGWGFQVGSDDYFTAYPSMTVAAADYLVDLGVLFLGLDTPSPHLHEFRLLHEALFRREMVIAECLVCLDEVQEEETFLVALPLKLAGLDGSPARIISVEGLGETG
jgi:arylformamidase